MNNYQKLVLASAFSAVLAGVTAPVFGASADVAAHPEVALGEPGNKGGAGGAGPAPAASRSRDAQSDQATAPSSYALHSALFRAPAAPAALQRR